MPVHAHRGPFATHDAGWVLKVAIAGTLAFSAAEMAIGSWAQSLALVADAWHNISDALALILIWFAFYIQTKAPSPVRTYGHHRAAVLAAFVGALGLLLVAGFLFYHGYRRLWVPIRPESTAMIAVGAAGAIINGLITAALRRASPSPSPSRVALLHMAGDTMAALGIVAAGFLVRLTGTSLFDPVLAILIAGLIIWTGWDVIAESLNILLEGLPRDLELDRVIAAIREVRGVEDVHDLHIWSLGAQTRALSCHVRIPKLPLPEGEAILCEVNQVLECRFHIRHTTIQLEHSECEVVNGCIIPAEIHR